MFHHLQLEFGKVEHLPTLIVPDRQLLQGGPAVSALARRAVGHYQIWRSYQPEGIPRVARLASGFSPLGLAQALGLGPEPITGWGFTAVARVLGQAFLKFLDPLAEFINAGKKLLDQGDDSLQALVIDRLHFFMVQHHVMLSTTFVYCYSVNTRLSIE